LIPKGNSLKSFYSSKSPSGDFSLRAIATPSAAKGLSTAGRVPLKLFSTAKALA